MEQNDTCAELKPPMEDANAAQEAGLRGTEASPRARGAGPLAGRGEEESGGAGSENPSQLRLLIRRLMEGQKELRAMNRAALSSWGGGGGGEGQVAGQRQRVWRPKFAHRRGVGPGLEATKNRLDTIFEVRVVM